MNSIYTKAISKENLVALLIFTLALSFLAVPTAFAQPTDFTHLVSDSIAEPMDSDPAWSYDTSSAELLMNVYETLLWFNRTNMDSYIPILATEWVSGLINETSPEGLTWLNRWTFTIRTGVTFHTTGGSVPGEGATLTPQDVEYSFERMLITDASTGPAWMIFEPLVGGYWMGDINETLFDLGTGTLNATTGWNTECDEMVDHAIESNATHVWFNLVMPYEPWLQIVAQQWGSILNQAWCVALGDWPGMNVDDGWADYHDPTTSPINNQDPSAPGPNLDAMLGTGPYMLDYWNKGVGNAWSIVRNPNYWRGWTTPYNPPEWGTPPPGGWIQGHVDRKSSNYIPEWSTRRLRFLGGVSDFTDVPREFMGQVLGQPGIDVVYPLPQLACTGAFLNYLVSDSSTHIGAVQPNGTFNEFGAPPNMFNDSDARLGFAHLFDFDTYLFAAFLDEAIAPVTPIVPGLAYYDASIGKAEEPVISQTKEYGISYEPAGTQAYNMTLAIEYLQKAWGGDLWANGFTIDLVYNEGNTARQTAAQLVQDALNEINALHGTKFHTNIVSIPWSVYKIEWKARTLPYFIVGWLADYPDAHNFAHPFMHSIGAFSRWQGILGVTEFPNAQTDALIEEGIQKIGSARQSVYTNIQQDYVDETPGWVLSQPTGRHWERDWVEGWYYNPIYPGNYGYDLWKAIGVAVQDVDVAVSTMTDVAAWLSTNTPWSGAKIELGLPLGDNTWTPENIPVNVNVSRVDSNLAAPFVTVVIGLGRRNMTGYEVIIDTDVATLGIGGSYSANFVWNMTFDPDLIPGNYTLYSVCLVASGFAADIVPANNAMNATGTLEVDTLLGDINVDGSVELQDFFVASTAFGSYPTHPSWDVRADVNEDEYVELLDFFTLSMHFGESFG